MTRILLIGNSHLAAFRKGWDVMKDAYPGVTIDFFAQPGPEYYIQRVDPKTQRYGALNEAAFSQHQLERLDRYNGARSVDLTAYDRIMVIGNQHGTADILKLIAHRDITGMRATDTAHLLSRETFDAVARDIAASFLPDPGWSAVQTAPVTFHAMPRPAETAFEKVDPDSNVGKTYAKFEACKDGIASALTDLDQVFTTYMHEIGLPFLTQPQATLTDYGLTRAEYNTHLQSFIGRNMKTDTDFHHMNGAYGNLCLHAAFPDILPQQQAA